MTHHATTHGSTHNGGDQPNTGYRVELPRTCDAIGMVLRDAYERDMGVPEDMLILLRQMNGATRNNRNNGTEG